VTVTPTAGSPLAKKYLLLQNTLLTTSLFYLPLLFVLLTAQQEKFNSGLGYEQIGVEAPASPSLVLTGKDVPGMTGKAW